jgi:hypothetical protein
MLHHHGPAGTYDVAASEAATRARSLMEQKIETGKQSAIQLYERVHAAVPVDAIVRGRGLAFQYGVGPEDMPVSVSAGGSPMGIHRHALQQMAGKAGIPGQYLAELVGAPEGWKRELAARTLTDHFTRTQVVQREDLSGSRHLVRAVNGEVRGFLSDRYRRLDSRPLLEAFAEGCRELGAVPVEGTTTDVRVALKAYLPMVFEPVPNEVMCLGVEWSNSDFGAGKHALRAFIYRLWCANGAVMEDAMSQVHLGGRLADTIEFSDRTYALDTRASVSALRDVVAGTLGPKSVNTLLATIRAADEKKVEWRSVSTLLGKKLLKEELKAARDAFDSEDVINLPAGKSIWRVSNAISWIAGKTEDQDRKLELQRLAGAVIHGKSEEAVAA